MDKYYYLAAQLPLLDIENTDGVMSKATFLEEAGKWLSKKDYSVLFSVDLDTFMTDSKHSVFAEFCAFEYSLRSELSKYRRSQKEDFEYKISMFPMSLIKEGTPLDAEKKILKLRWDFLEEKSHGHYSDLDFLIIYFLKLQIMHRIVSFDAVKGEEIYRQSCVYKTEEGN